MNRFPWRSLPAGEIHDGYRNAVRTLRRRAARIATDYHRRQPITTSPGSIPCTCRVAPPSTAIDATIHPVVQEPEPVCGPATRSTRVNPAYLPDIAAARCRGRRPRRSIATSFPADGRPPRSADRPPATHRRWRCPARDFDLGLFARSGGRQYEPPRAVRVQRIAGIQFPSGDSL